MRTFNPYLFYITHRDALKGFDSLTRHGIIMLALRFLGIVPGIFFYLTLAYLSKARHRATTIMIMTAFFIPFFIGIIIPFPFNIGMRGVRLYVININLPPTFI